MVEASQPFTGPRIRIEGATKSFNGRVVVSIDDLTIGVHPVEGLIGPNGAGKTTLMRMIMRSVTPDRGTISLLETRDGQEHRHLLSRCQPHQIPCLGVVKTNQVIQDFEPLTVYDSVMLSVADPADERPYHIYRDDRVWAQHAAEINVLRERFGFRQLSAYAKSAGEKKLLDIIRCLLLRPKVLLLDEPTAGLPGDVTDEVMRLIREMALGENVSVVIVEHDLNVIWNMCDYVHFMAEGSVILQGVPDWIRNQETVIEKYVGSGHVGG